MTHARLRDINLFPEKIVLAYNFLIFQEIYIEQFSKDRASELWQPRSKDPEQRNERLTFSRHVFQAVYVWPVNHRWGCYDNINFWPRSA